MGVAFQNEVFLVVDTRPDRFRRAGVVGMLRTAPGGILALYDTGRGDLFLLEDDETLDVDATSVTFYTQEGLVQFQKLTLELYDEEVLPELSDGAKIFQTDTDVVAYYKELCDTAIR